MAKKATTTSKARPKTKTTSSTSATRATAKKTVRPSPKTMGAPVTKQRTYNRFSGISAAGLIAEFLGTFLLTLIAMTVGLTNSFYIGLALAVLVAMLFNLSGAHLNPAVSFGLWTMRRITASKMLTYWVAQLVGAMAALLAMNMFAGSGVSMSFGNFANFDWSIFSAELIAMTAFMFGIAAAATRAQTDMSKAMAIGFSLFLAITVGTGLISSAQAGNSTNESGQAANERLTKIEGVTVNPAVALAVSEVTPQQNPFGEAQPVSDDTPSSRLTMEVILGTLIGAALGGNLYLLLNRNREE